MRRRSVFRRQAPYTLTGDRAGTSQKGGDGMPASWNLQRRFRPQARSGRFTAAEGWLPYREIFKKAVRCSNGVSRLLLRWKRRSTWRMLIMNLAESHPAREIMNWRAFIMNSILYGFAH